MGQNVLLKCSVGKFPIIGISCGWAASMEIATARHGYRVLCPTTIRLSILWHTLHRGYANDIKHQRKSHYHFYLVFLNAVRAIKTLSANEYRTCLVVFTPCGKDMVMLYAVSDAIAAPRAYGGDASLGPLMDQEGWSVNA